MSNSSSNTIAGIELAVEKSQYRCWKVAERHHPVEDNPDIEIREWRKLPEVTSPDYEEIAAGNVVMADDLTAVHGLLQDLHPVPTASRIGSASTSRVLVGQQDTLYTLENAVFVADEEGLTEADAKQLGVFFMASCVLGRVCDDGSNPFRGALAEISVKTEPACQGEAEQPRGRNRRRSYYSHVCAHEVQDEIVLCQYQANYARRYTTALKAAGRREAVTADDLRACRDSLNRELPIPANYYQGSGLPGLMLEIQETIQRLDGYYGDYAYRDHNGFLRFLLRVQQTEAASLKKLQTFGGYARGYRSYARGYRSDSELFAEWIRAELRVPKTRKRLPFMRDRSYSANYGWFAGAARVARGQCPLARFREQVRQRERRQARERHVRFASWLRYRTFDQPRGDNHEDTPERPPHVTFTVALARRKRGEPGWRTFRGYPCSQSDSGPAESGD